MEIAIKKIITHKISITGIVQGVGFRPHVYKLAVSNRLNGFVLNDTTGVTIEIQGSEEEVLRFERELKHNPPIRSRIDTFNISIKDSSELFNYFSIKESKSSDEKIAQISPDLDICKDCLRELFNPNDRRYLYPFINCTNCGPRFTIIKDVPYDRPLTTMEIFKMCEVCQKEYDDPMNRRFHAQPNACSVCGPKVYLCDNHDKEILIGGTSDENEILFKKVSELLKEGKIIAVKGIGGFHLACDALNEEAVSTLRKRKFREDKPFALMFHDIKSVGLFCEISKQEKTLLESVAHPVVLLRKRKNKDVAHSVAPNNHYLGAMVPYSPIHHLLFHFFSNPLVMTSGNVSDEPIVFKNSEAFEYLSKIADFFLLHDRDINIRCDDSVYRIWSGLEYPVRRSRGYVPDSIRLEWEFSEPVLACGPEQKNTFALAKGNRIYLSHHIGDMENYEVLRSLEKGVIHFKKIFDIEPTIVAYDLHPDYLSTKYAQEYPDFTESGEKVIKVGIQHHHAHAVSCMVENGINRPVIAVTLDGTGYGEDGTIWGGEILLTEYHRFKRLGYFETAQMPGGEAAIDNPWQMAVSYLYEIYNENLFEIDLPFLNSIAHSEKDIVLGLLKTGFNSPMTSSCGRLFDGVAAIVGVRNHVNYEGQAAVEFEQYISQKSSFRKDKSDIAYDFYLMNNSEGFIIEWESMIKQAVEDVKNRVSLSYISIKFHNGLAKILCEAVERSREMTEINEVVLSGGVFMNIYLLTRLHNLLENSGFTVYTHRQVPANDGGIALGQAVIASAKRRYALNASLWENVK